MVWDRGLILSFYMWISISPNTIYWNDCPWGHPGGPVVKNPPSNVGGTGSIPGQGNKIPCAEGQLSPTRATTTELVRLN